MEKIYDVLVVGGGPAGQNAAYHLAKAGVSVCLVEQDKLPKEKVCGGGLRAAAIKRFPYLELIVRNITLSVIRKITVYSPNFHRVIASTNHDLYFLLRRFDFSQALSKLCSEAGVEQMFGQRVQRILREEKGVTAFLRSGEQIKTKVVIGCDGVNSLVARELGLSSNSYSANHYGLASEQELEFDTNLSQEEMLIYYGFQNRLGYGWVFPKGKLINVGIGYSNTIKGINPQQVHRSFVDFLIERKVLPKNFPVREIRTWILPWGGPLKKTYGNRVLVCGDAARFVHPLTVEGIYYALCSGELAAKTIIQSLKVNNYSEKSLAQYQKLWQKEFGREFETMLMVQKILAKHLGIMDDAIEIYEKDTRVHQLILDYITGRISFQKVKLGLWPKILYLLAKTGRKKLLWPKSYI